MRWVKIGHQLVDLDRIIHFEESTVYLVDGEALLDNGMRLGLPLTANDLARLLDDRIRDVPVIDLSQTEYAANQRAIADRSNQ